MQTHDAGDLAYHLKKFGMQHGLGELSPVYSSFHCPKTGGGVGLLGSVAATPCTKSKVDPSHQQGEDFKQKGKASFSFESLPSSSSILQDNHLAGYAVEGKVKVKREDPHATQNGGDYYDPEADKPADSEQTISNGLHKFLSPLSTPLLATAPTPNGVPGAPKKENAASPATMWSSSTSSLSSPGGVGVPLRTALCPALFYDCTHDNETPTQKFTPGAALPLSVLLAAAGCAVGSTRGFDEIVPRTLSVVGEDRFYEDFHPEIPLLNPVSLLAGGARGRPSKAGGGLSKNRDKDGGRSSSSSTVAHSGATGETPILEDDGEEEDGAPSSFFEGGDGGGGENKKTLEQKNRDNILDEIVVKWTHGGNHVSIKGDWDGWAHDIFPDKQGDGVFEFHIKRGVHYAKEADHPAGVQKLHFKFIVDGNWNVNSDLPCEKDGWNVNNVVCTDGSSPDSSSSWKKGKEPTDRHNDTTNTGMSA